MKSTKALKPDRLAVLQRLGVLIHDAENAHASAWRHAELGDWQEVAAAAARGEAVYRAISELAATERQQRELRP